MPLAAGEVPVGVDADATVFACLPAFPPDRVETRGRQGRQRLPVLVEAFHDGHVHQLVMDRLRAGSSRRPSMTRAGCPWDSASRGGTMRSRRGNPTAFSTSPFSLPEYGLRNLASILWRERNASNTVASVTWPFASRWPAPVALSSTSTGGTPPTCPNTESSPWHRHSGLATVCWTGS